MEMETEEKKGTINMRWVALAAVLVFALTVVAVVLKSYSDHYAQPGTGPEAEAGFVLSKKVIGELEAFKKQENKYPQSLDELVPKYLDRNPQKDMNAPVEIGYYPDPAKNSYSLKFFYDSPTGLVECNFFHETRKWNCGGKQ
jgi:hypothetical protein